MTPSHVLFDETVDKAMQNIEMYANVETDLTKTIDIAQTYAMIALAHGINMVGVAIENACLNEIADSLKTLAVEVGSIATQVQRLDDSLSSGDR